MIRGLFDLASAEVAGRPRARNRRVFRNALLALLRGGAGRRGRETMRVARGFGDSQRRVVIKAHVARLCGRGVKAAALHQRYIHREGVEKDGTRKASSTGPRDPWLPLSIRTASPRREASVPDRGRTRGRWRAGPERLRTPADEAGGSGPWPRDRVGCGQPLRHRGTLTPTSSSAAWTARGARCVWTATTFRTAFGAAPRSLPPRSSARGLRSTFGARATGKSARSALRRSIGSSRDARRAIEWRWAGCAGRASKRRS